MAWWEQGSNNAAAIFAPDGTCRGWGVTDFAGPSGYSTGLILVYSNSASEPGLEVRIWDADLDSLPQCSDNLNFVANGIQGSLSDPVVFYGVYDPLVGCTDQAACNYLESAITDNGSCIYPAAAMNAPAITWPHHPALTMPHALIPSCTWTAKASASTTLTAMASATNWKSAAAQTTGLATSDPDATDDDCSCNFPFYPLDCSGNCYIDYRRRRCVRSR